MEMENLTREIAKIGTRSLVEVYNKGDFGKEVTKKFVVCSNYNPSKAYTTQWELGHYFTVWYEEERETMLKAAMKYILDIKEYSISWERMSEIATLAIDGLFEDDSEQAEIYLDETMELTDEEREYFGRKRPRKYKIARVRMEKMMYCYKNFVVPEDWEDSDIRELAEEYIPDVSDYDWDCDDWENTADVDSYEDRELDYDDAYDCCTMNDIDDLD